MHLNWLAFAVPLFLLLMLVEYLVAKQKKLPYFKLHGSIANITIGIAERLMDVFVTGVFFFVYKYLHQHFGVFNIRPSVVLWVVMLLFTDFIWYWYHRLAHEINILWAAHVVHHQSEEFNYTVSARITVFQAFIRTGFWAILPIIGFPPGMIASMLLVHGIYPFFIHTRTIGKLGILEYVLVTPSHHRVHHASNDSYLDKNYGDMFIIWDKLFGTFQKEDDTVPIQFGLTKPLDSYDFLWQHFHFFIEIWFAMKKLKGIKNKLSVLFGAPTFFDETARTKAADAFGIHRTEKALTSRLNRYVSIQLASAIVLLFVFTLFSGYIPASQQILITAVLLTTLMNCGAIMEHKTWTFYLEFARLFLVAISMTMLFPGVYTIALLLMGAILLVCFFNKANERYLSLIYDI